MMYKMKHKNVYIFETEDYHLTNLDELQKLVKM